MSRAGLLAALAASLAAVPYEDPRPEPRRRSPGGPGPADGRIIEVSPEVYAEVLKGHTLADVNAMPYAQRLQVIEEAIRRVAEHQRQSSNAAAVQLREERARRKAAAFAARQPKNTRSNP